MSDAHQTTLFVIPSLVLQGGVAQLVTCLTGDPGIASSIPPGCAEIDHEIISTAILLPSADSKRVVVSFKGKYVHKACPGKKCG